MGSLMLGLSAGCTAAVAQFETAAARNQAPARPHRGVNLGDLRLMQPEIPSWETLLETTFYQMKGGGCGLVHEGRYQLEPFDRAVERFTGRARRHTPAELLQYHFALLRGGTRPFGKHWGKPSTANAIPTWPLKP